MVDKGASTFYGQELNTTTYNLARMNLMMHGVDYGNMTLRNADTLAMDWPDGLDQDGVDRPHFSMLLLPTRHIHKNGMLIRVN